MFCKHQINKLKGGVKLKNGKSNRQTHVQLYTSLLFYLLIIILTNKITYIKPVTTINK